MNRISLDPVGNSLSIGVLLGIVIAWAWTGRRWLGARASAEPEGWRLYAVLVLALIGLVVAVYLAYVETSGVQATCGPVGDCNTVQQSEYAAVFGVHVGVIGVVGYASIIVAWFASQQAWRTISDWAALAVHALAVLGAAFSTYLTFLEPFVIGATCLWCLSSAVVMTALMLVSTDAARAARLRLAPRRARRASGSRQ